MSIIEFATLELLEPHKLSTAPIPKLIQTLRTRQSAHSAYPLIFFTDAAKPRINYVVSGWHHVQQHNSWIESEEYREVWRSLDPFFRRSSLLHIDMDYDDIPKDCQALLCQRYHDLNELTEGSSGLEEGGAPWIRIGKDLASEDVYKLGVFRKETVGRFVEAGQSRTMNNLAMLRTTIPRE